MVERTTRVVTDTCPGALVGAQAALSVVMHDGRYNRISDALDYDVYCHLLASGAPLSALEDLARVRESWTSVEASEDDVEALSSAPTMRVE